MTNCNGSRPICSISSGQIQDSSKKTIKLRRRKAIDEIKQVDSDIKPENLRDRNELSIGSILRKLLLLVSSIVILATCQAVQCIEDELNPTNQFVPEINKLPTTTSEATTTTTRGSLPSGSLEDEAKLLEYVLIQQQQQQQQAQLQNDEQTSGELELGPNKLYQTNDGQEFRLSNLQEADTDTQADIEYPLSSNSQVGLNGLSPQEQLELAISSFSQQRQNHHHQQEQQHEQQSDMVSAREPIDWDDLESQSSALDATHGDTKAPPLSPAKQLASQQAAASHSMSNPLQVVNNAGLGGSSSISSAVGASVNAAQNLGSAIVNTVSNAILGTSSNGASSENHETHSRPSSLANSQANNRRPPLRQQTTRPPNFDINYDTDNNEFNGDINFQDWKNNFSGKPMSPWLVAAIKTVPLKLGSLGWKLLQVLAWKKIYKTHHPKQGEITFEQEIGDKGSSFHGEHGHQYSGKQMKSFGGKMKDFDGSGGMMGVASIAKGSLADDISNSAYSNKMGRSAYPIIRRNPAFAYPMLPGLAGYSAHPDSVSAAANQAALLHPALANPGSATAAAATAAALAAVLQTQMYNQAGLDIGNDEFDNSLPVPFFPFSSSASRPKPTTSDQTGTERNSTNSSNSSKGSSTNGQARMRRGLNMARITNAFSPFTQSYAAALASQPQIRLSRGQPIPRHHLMGLTSSSDTTRQMLANHLFYQNLYDTRSASPMAYQSGLNLKPLLFSSPANNFNDNIQSGYVPLSALESQSDGYSLADMNGDQNDSPFNINSRSMRIPSSSELSGIATSPLDDFDQANLVLTKRAEVDPNNKLDYIESVEKWFPSRKDTTRSSILQRPLKRVSSLFGH